MAKADKYTKPSKRRSHKDPAVDAEFQNVYITLSQLHLGPFRFYYDYSQDCLHLQVCRKDMPGEYQTIQKWWGIDETLSTTGNTEIYGSATTLVGSLITGAGHR